MTFTLKQKQNLLIYLKAKEGKILHLEVNFSRIFDKKSLWDGLALWCFLVHMQQERPRDDATPDLAPKCFLTMSQPVFPGPSVDWRASLGECCVLTGRR